MKYAISDIHGEYDKLRALIDVLNKDASEYIFLGDYLDKGEKVKETIDFLVNLADSKKCVFLAGDHEYAWRRYLEGEERFGEFLLNYGGTETMESYLGKKDPEAAAAAIHDKRRARELLNTHARFFNNLQPYYEVDGFLCIHAGVNPKNAHVPLVSQSAEELVFIRDEFIHSKFLYEGKRFIFGHTAFPEPYRDDYKFGIDTGAVYPEMGNLTAFNIEEEFFVQKDKGRFS